MDLEDAIKEAYEFAPADIIYFDTLEIMHNDLDESIKVVRSYRGITTEDGTFIPVMFDFALPKTEGGVRGEMVVTLNGIPLSARASIRSITGKVDPVTVMYRQYIKNTTDYPDPTIDPDPWTADASLPVALSVTQIKETRMGIEARACFPDLVGLYFPRRLMTTTDFPGLRTI